MLTELPVAELEAFFADNLSATANDIPMRALLHAFADDHSIPL
jgi:phosphotransferase system enzyme I (PtsP)